MYRGERVQKSRARFGPWPRSTRRPRPDVTALSGRTDAFEETIDPSSRAIAERFAPPRRAARACPPLSRATRSTGSRAHAG